MNKRTQSILVLSFFVWATPALAYCSMTDCPDVKSGWGCKEAGSQDFNQPYRITLQSYVCVTSGMSDLVAVVKLVRSDDVNIRARIDVDDCSYRLDDDNFQYSNLSSGGFQITIGLGEFDTYILSPQITDRQKYLFSSNFGNSPRCEISGGEVLK